MAGKPHRGIKSSSVSKGGIKARQLLLFDGRTKPQTIPVSCDSGRKRGAKWRRGWSGRERVPTRRDAALKNHQRSHLQTNFMGIVVQSALTIQWKGAFVIVWGGKTHHGFEGDTMRKILTALVVAASISAAAIATSSNAKAWGGWGWGWGPGAVVGGVVAGALIGSAIASRPY